MSQPTLYWGERTELLDKKLAYVFSLDASYDLDLQRAGWAEDAVLLPVKAAPTAVRQWATYHVVDERLVSSPDGRTLDVPRARVVDGDDRMQLDRSGVISLDGRLLLETDTASRISVEYQGVFQPSGGTSRMRRFFQGEPPEPVNEPMNELGGRVFVATRHESEQAKMRWLVQNQLVGVGRAIGRPKRLPYPLPSLSPGGGLRFWTLTFSFDLYLAI